MPPHCAAPARRADEGEVADAGEEQEYRLAGPGNLEQGASVAGDAPTRNRRPPQDTLNYYSEDAHVRASEGPAREKARKEAIAARRAEEASAAARARGGGAASAAGVGEQSPAAAPGDGSGGQTTSRASAGRDRAETAAAVAGTSRDGPAATITFPPPDTPLGASAARRSPGDAPASTRPATPGDVRMEPAQLHGDQTRAASDSDSERRSAAEIPARASVLGAARTDLAGGRGQEFVGRQQHGVPRSSQWPGMAGMQESSTTAAGHVERTGAQIERSDGDENLTGLTSIMNTGARGVELVRVAQQAVAAPAARAALPDNARTVRMTAEGSDSGQQGGTAGNDAVSGSAARGSATERNRPRAPLQGNAPAVASEPDRRATDASASAQASAAAAAVRRQLAERRRMHQQRERVGEHSERPAAGVPGDGGDHEDGDVDETEEAAGTTQGQEVERAPTEEGVEGPAAAPAGNSVAAQQRAEVNAERREREEHRRRAELRRAAEAQVATTVACDTPLVVFVSAAGGVPGAFCRTEMFVVTIRANDRHPHLRRLLNLPGGVTQRFPEAMRILQHVKDNCPSASVYSGSALPPRDWRYSIVEPVPPGDFVYHGRLDEIVDSTERHHAKLCDAPKPWLDELREKLAGQTGFAAAHDIPVVHMFMEHLLLRMPGEGDSSTAGGSGLGASQPRAGGPRGAGGGSARVVGGGDTRSAAGPSASSRVGTQGGNGNAFQAQHGTHQPLDGSTAEAASTGGVEQAAGSNQTTASGARGRSAAPAPSRSSAGSTGGQPPALPHGQWPAGGRAQDQEGSSSGAVEQATRSHATTASGAHAASRSSAGSTGSQRPEVLGGEWVPAGARAQAEEGSSTRAVEQATRSNATTSSGAHVPSRSTGPAAGGQDAAHLGAQWFPAGGRAQDDAGSSSHAVEQATRSNATTASGAHVPSRWTAPATGGLHAAHLGAQSVATQGSSNATAAPPPQLPPPVILLPAPQPPANQQGAAGAWIRAEYAEACVDAQLCYLLTSKKTRGAGILMAPQAVYVYDTAYASWRVSGNIDETSQAMGLSVNYPSATVAVSFGAGGPANTFAVSPNMVAEAFGVPLGTWQGWKTRFKNIAGVAERIDESLKRPDLSTLSRDGLQELKRRLAWYNVPVRKYNPMKYPDDFAGEDGIWKWSSTAFERDLAPWRQK
ncbi:hypothetical protein AURDEDRAFT_159227 [Auricularia subglabra TFB-10046 SS5]|nr:hypothetical protein AURDEDRAFT_159227 [Auricularia subglabra TFB-10046 SS5]